MCRAEKAGDPWLRLQLASEWRPVPQARSAEAARARQWLAAAGLADLAPRVSRTRRSSAQGQPHVDLHVSMPLDWQPAPRRPRVTLQRLREVGTRLLQIAGATPPPAGDDGIPPRAYLEPMLDFVRFGATVRGRF